LQPEQVLGQLEKGRLSPLYLFYGPSEFLLEKVLETIRESFVPEPLRDFNLQLLYGDETGAEEVIDAARSLPFMGEHRLIVVRRTENLPAVDLDKLVPYLEKPVPTTCLIFVSARTDFRKPFYRTIRDAGLAVNFKGLKDHQVVPWIKRLAKDLGGLRMDGEACAYLHQMVGNRLRDLYNELEKLYLRYGNTPVGVREVEELVTHSRIYTIFELMDKVSLKQGAEAISVLHRFLEEEDREGVLRVLGMLTRQTRLLWQTLCIVARGGGSPEVARTLSLAPFLGRKLVEQSERWSLGSLEKAFHLLYQADGFIKSGSRGPLVLENLVLSLCSSGSSREGATAS
jgi:DNA polymerase-3 subunit delta